MRILASIEFDGRNTVTYTMEDGDSSYFRVLPEVGRLIGASKDLLQALVEGARVPADDVNPPCWCPPSFEKVSEGRHSYVCDKSRRAWAKAVRV